MRLSLLVIVALLTLYGGLYPFDIASPQPGELQQFLGQVTLISSRGDMLANLGFFMPWGIAGLLAFAPRLGTARAVGVTLVTGLLLSFCIEIAQLWLLSRVSSWADVFWNGLGTLAGIALARFVERRLGGSGRWRPEQLLALGLLTGWLVVQWLPLIPSLDAQLVKDNLKAALQDSTLNFGILVPTAAMAAMCGYLLSLVTRPVRSAALLPLLLIAAAVGQIVIIDTRLGVSELAGFAAGCALWWALLRFASPPRMTLVLALGLVAACTLPQVLPFVLRDSPSDFSWMPFAAMLKGSMLANARNLADSLLIYAALLFLVQMSGGRPLAASVGLALWVLLIELLQTMIQGKHGDLTMPIWVLIIGQVFAVLQQAAKRPATPQRAGGVPTSAPASKQGGTPAGARPVVVPARATMRPRTAPWLVLAATVLLVTTGFHQLLRLPDVPYNVRELFVDGGSLPTLATFALALLWLGAGPVALHEVLLRLRRRAAWLAPLLLAVCLTSLALLYASVDEESIGDVAGSSNLYWFVTEKDSWGVAWREVFRRLDASEAISWLERCVRYAALYGPLPMFLALLLAARHPSRWRDLSATSAVALLTVAGLLLWLCKAIAFDWSSTDNLNELIARDGPWGWGGGGYLYALLLLLCLNGVALQELPGAGLWRSASILVFSAAALPLGWWLLNQGLESQIEKYSAIFSGAQFLLGPNRTRLLSEETLFLRWCAVQTGAAVVLGTGLWLGRALFVRPLPDSKANPAAAMSRRSQRPATHAAAIAPPPPAKPAA